MELAVSLDERKYRKAEALIEILETLKGEEPYFRNMAKTAPNQLTRKPIRVRINRCPVQQFVAYDDDFDRTLLSFQEQK
jgi:hypothetical protein